MTTTTTIPESARTDTRELRALVLAEERFEEIALSHRGGTYTVPSLHGDHTYDVTYTAREEGCHCPDWEFGHTCYHVLAAVVVRAKTGVCSGCGRCFRHRVLVELHEDNHDDLTYFDGDLLCKKCADNAGVAH
jgi:SWIM zinc finger